MLDTTYDGEFNTIPSTIKQHIRHLDIGVFWFGEQYIKPALLVDGALPSIMTNLENLRLELHQPLYKKVFGRPDQRVRKWLDWLRPILARVNEDARGNTKLRVELLCDGDEMLNLARSCLRDVDCVLGHSWLYGWPICKGTCRRRECENVSEALEREISEFVDARALVWID